MLYLDERFMSRLLVKNADSSASPLERLLLLGAYSARILWTETAAFARVDGHMEIGDHHVTAEQNAIWGISVECIETTLGSSGLVHSGIIAERHTALLQITQATYHHKGVSP